MFESGTWDKLLYCIFENFEIALVKQGQIQSFEKSWGWFIPKITQARQVITDYWLIKPR